MVASAVAAVRAVIVHRMQNCGIASRRRVIIMSMIGNSHDFSPIMSVAQEMRGFDRPWFVCGGWAIDLFLGWVTREHGDREVGIYRADQMMASERFGERALFKAVDGEWLR